MARIKIKTNLNTARMKRIIASEFRKATPSALKDSILKEIKGGRSPVKGKGRFVKYSDDYLRAIRKGTLPFPKRKRPVNMTLSGVMLENLFSEITAKGLKIGIRSELADIHNRQGAGKSKVVRRLLPTNRGEEFNKSIQLDLREALVKARNRAISKINN